MKNFKALACSLGLASLLLGASACGGGGPIKDMEKVVDEMCACKDAECAKKVGEKVEKLGEKYRDKDPKDFSDEDQAKMKDLAMKLAECGKKAMGAGAEE